MNTETFISTFLTNLRFQRSSFVQFSSCVTSASALNVSILTAIKPGQSVRSLVYTALCTYQCNAGGGGGRARGGDLIVFVVPGVGHLTDVVLPGEGIFESFFARRGDI